MEEWYCFKCKDKMTKADIQSTFLEISRSIEGLKCPKCGTAYLTEKTVIEEVTTAEEDMEAKLG